MLLTNEMLWGIFFCFKTTLRTYVLCSLDEKRSICQYRLFLFLYSIIFFSAMKGEGGKKQYSPED